MKNELLYFNKMITPKIITFIYWLLLIASVFVGINFMFFGAFGGVEFTLGSFITGLFAIAIGAVAARVWCELLIVIFKINENLRKVLEKE